MKIKLYHRHYGVHTHLKETEVEGELSDYATTIDSELDKYLVDEDKLIKSLPSNFLPVKPVSALLTVEDKDGCGIGLYNVEKFRIWAKYFDSYVLGLSEE